MFFIMQCTKLLFSNIGSHASRTAWSYYSPNTGDAYHMLFIIYYLKILVKIEDR